MARHCPADHVLCKRRCDARTAQKTTSASIFDIALNQRKPISCGLPGPSEPKLNQLGLLWNTRPTSESVFIGTRSVFDDKNERAHRGDWMIGHEVLFRIVGHLRSEHRVIASESNTMPTV